MSWSRLGDKPLFEPMLTVSPTHTCGNRAIGGNDLNMCHAGFSWGSIKIYLHFLSFLNKMVHVAKIFHPKDNDQFILHSQYRSCWCPGDARSHGNSSHYIDIVTWEYSGFSTKNINMSRIKRSCSCFVLQINLSAHMVIMTIWFTLCILTILVWYAGRRCILVHHGGNGRVKNSRKGSMSDTLHISG